MKATLSPSPLFSTKLSRICGEYTTTQHAMETQPKMDESSWEEESMDESRTGRGEVNRLRLGTEEERRTGGIEGALTEQRFEGT